jgi:SAM-dependent methyltransferase
MTEAEERPQDWHTWNQQWWDERVPAHLASEFYDVDSFVGGGSTLRAAEIEELGPVDGLSLLHLQCHIGLDTLSCARRGARVTGLDFSGPAISAARAIADRAELVAEFVEADVYAASEALRNRHFDITYTGRGALCWLPDIERWAHQVASLTSAGGRFYLMEMHPITEALGDDDLTFEYPYFQTEVMLFNEPGTYAERGASTQHNRSAQWLHGIGDVVSALAAEGFRIDFLHEHEYTVFQRWPFLERRADGTYRFPEGTPTLPLMYSLGATAPRPR